MKNISKGRKPATSMAVPSSDGSLSKIFSYNDNAVTFRPIDGSLMVNATQMAKPFGRRVSAWLRLFILALIDGLPSKSETYKDTQIQLFKTL